MLPRALILRTAGTNCARETAHAFELAGARTQFLHLNRLIENPRLLDEHQILALPGGFSYGDDIAAGRIFANQLVHHLADALHRFVEGGKPIIGICNGFQVLVKTGLLPGRIAGRTGQTCTLAHNDSGRFIDKWITVEPRSKKCIWTAGLDGEIDLPIAHGEGKFIAANDEVRQALWNQDQIALTYKDENPNGSIDAIAGICDETGLILGLMPHPERHLRVFQHPNWAKIADPGREGAGVKVFKTAVEYAAGAVTARS